MRPSTITWANIYKEFRKNCPNYSKKAIHYEPNGFLEIRIFMTDGTKMTYDYDRKELKFLG
ncbi:hypothetical protein AGMMS49975_11910 [Clostridia bacterium]|nr:hypothetical protein AGMMS49975_11910 [Clostridia bacterium]